MYIIGIAGGTGSGKTTVVRKIAEALPKTGVAVIPQDSYYNDNSAIPMEERRKINFDHPNAFDWKLLIEQVNDLRNGKAIEQPTYSYLESNRMPETVHIEPCEVIIIEGIMALCSKELRDLMDLKIFVDADPDERLIRVISRDMAERGRTAQMVMDRYIDVLKPMHLEFIEPTKRYADLIIPQGGNNQKAIDIMRTYIIHRLKPTHNI
ncbi:MAG: uridine kinase [Bacteroidaceae bacterium]|nr:uridine kinase [Bacteroidaceae bacterium]